MGKRSALLTIREIRNNIMGCAQAKAKVRAGHVAGNRARPPALCPCCNGIPSRNIMGEELGCSKCGLEKPLWPKVQAAMKCAEWIDAHGGGRDEKIEKLARRAVGKKRRE